MTVRCIVCSAAVQQARSLDAAMLSEALEAYTGKPLTGDEAIADYAILRCDACALEFADPLLPGSDAFYHWITAQPGYYPPVRWEWDTVLARIAEAARKEEVCVLDVGCGGGDFLALAAGLAGVKAVGIDMTSASIEKCRARGLDVHLGDLESFTAEHPGRTFDFVTSFHCIEHVSDPVGFLQAKARLVKPGGAVMVSAPLSPMSFETLWFDPLNHPPHHLSRWSPQALASLARRAAMDLWLETEPAASVISRTLRAMALADRGSKPISRGEKLGLALANPLGLIRELRRQQRRTRLNGRAVGDTFLAAFTPAAAA